MSCQSNIETMGFGNGKSRKQRNPRVRLSNCTGQDDCGCEFCLVIMNMTSRGSEVVDDFDFFDDEYGDDFPDEYYTGEEEAY